MSMVGDLAASAIKRNHNIKDYGKLIPGHGGIMDRFDSMTDVFSCHSDDWTALVPKVRYKEHSTMKKIAILGSLFY